MNRLYKYIYILSCIVLVSGCLNVDEFEEPAVKVVRTFHAQMEEHPATKTVLGEKNAEGITPVLWMADDKIGVIPADDTQTYFDPFVNKNSELADTAIFEGVIAPAFDYYSIYPYDEKTILQSDAIIFRLNTVQTYKAGSFDQGAFPMVARAVYDEGGNFDFKNLCGVLEINLTGLEKIKSLTFSAERPVSGKFSVNMKYEDYPEIQPYKAESKSITLNCGDGVQLNESTPTSFYFVLPPAEYEKFNLIILTTDGKMMVKQSKKPLDIKRSYIIEAGALAYVEDVAFDLSEIQTANCYVVTSAGSYKFNASVIGNGADGILPDAEFHTSEPTISPSSVEVLWETNGSNVKAVGEVVPNATLTEDGYVNFFATGVEGNALIAAKDADGKVIWSWHIWVTDAPQEQQYVNSNGVFYVHDRNLGATRADQGTGEEYKDSYGLLYQWGRKDPFAAGCFDYLRWDDTSPYSVKDLIEQPTMVSSPNRSLSSTANWTSDKIIDFWSDQCKSIYDPCPVGYRVASSEVWSDFTDLSCIENSYDYGLMVKFNQSESAWYPYSPYIYRFGSYRDLQTIQLWTSSQELTTENNRVTSETGMTYDNQKHEEGFSLTRFDDMSALSVRCMKDDGYLNNLRPKVEMLGIKEKTSQSAIVVFNLVSEGASEVTEVGVIYGTAPGLTLDNDSKVVAASGESQVEITGLSEGTRYYVVAYATNSDGTSYSKEIKFNTNFEGYKNLSDFRTANCYLVPEYGAFVFDATVKGNSNESVGIPVEVEVLWETKNTTAAVSVGDIVSDVSLEDGKIYFTTNGTPGNALIAVKDANGTIIWSWHIWVSDYEPDANSCTYLSGAVMMDRNLGALNNGYDPESFGFLYQWGRKDPLLGSADGSTTFATTAPVVTKQHKVVTNPWEYTFANPIHRVDELNNDAYAWGRTKTMYDPCPLGWRVPDGGYDGVWKRMIYGSPGIVNEYDSNKGLDYWTINPPYSTPATVYPAPGYTDEFCDEGLIFTGSALYCWSCDYVSTNTAFGMHLFNRIECELYAAKESEFSVRCMKETLDNLVLNTSPASEISETSAKISGSMHYLSKNASVLEMGFVWSESTNSPDINCEKITMDIQEGDFSASLTDLKAGATYSVRTFANDAGQIVYGNVISFTTLMPGDTEKVPEDNYEWE